MEIVKRSLITKDINIKFSIFFTLYIVTHSSDERLKYDLDFENKVITIKYSRSYIDREDDKLYKELMDAHSSFYTLLDQYNKKSEKLRDFELTIPFSEIENLTSLIKK